MNSRIIQAQINLTEEMIDISLIFEDMYRTYMQLDMLAEENLSAVYFHDIRSGLKLPLKKSTDNSDTADHTCIVLSSNSIECIKRLIRQCHQNPYDAEWLHYDFEACSPNGKEYLLCIHLTRNPDRVSS